MTPEMRSLLEALRDNPGAISAPVAASAAEAALREIDRLGAALRVNALRAGFGHAEVDEIINAQR